MRCMVRSRNIDINSSIELLFIAISGWRIRVIIAYRICLYYVNTVIIIIILVNRSMGRCHCVLSQCIKIMCVISIYFRVVLLLYCWT